MFSVSSSLVEDHYCCIASPGDFVKLAVNGTGSWYIHKHRNKDVRQSLSAGPGKLRSAFPPLLSPPPFFPPRSFPVPTLVTSQTVTSCGRNISHRGHLLLDKSICSPRMRERTQNALAQDRCGTIASRANCRGSGVCWHSLSASVR